MQWPRCKNGQQCIFADKNNPAPEADQLRWMIFSKAAISTGRSCPLRAPAAADAKHLFRRTFRRQRRLSDAPLQAISASSAIAGVDLMHRIRKSQFTLGKPGSTDKTPPGNWNAVLAARSVLGSQALGCLDPRRWRHSALRSAEERFSPQRIQTRIQ